MKTKTKFICANCSREFTTEFGLKIHMTRMHTDAGTYITTIKIPADEGTKLHDLKDQTNTGWEAIAEAPGVYAKGQITAAPDAQQRNQDNVDAMRYYNTSAAPKPFHYAILDDFEAACRHDEIKGAGNPDEIETIEDNYRRAKRLLALRILVLKTRADLCDTLERELMS